MRRRILVGFVLCIMFPLHNFAKSTPPKREFRGAWIATVVNLDWPSTYTLNPSVQRLELITILDELKEAGINIIMFQVRPECDALYESSIEPWSF